MADILEGAVLGSISTQSAPYQPVHPGMQPLPTQKIRITQDQLALIKKTIFRDATDEELALFKYICELRQLDPFARQIYARKQRQFNYKSQKYEETMVVITGIDGFRLIAERSKKYAGQLGPFFTDDGEKWLDAWIKDTPPKACKVGILRHDFKEPIWAMARFNAYCPHNDKGEPTGLWKTMFDGQLAKCTEALGLRRAFPEELSGLYTSDEMQQAVTTPAVTAIEVPKDDPLIDDNFAEVEAQSLPTEGFLKEYPAIKERISEHFKRLHVTKSKAREIYPDWPDNPDDIPMVDLPKIAEAFGMDLTLP